MTEIPPNATIRQEYVKCGNPDCQNQHGPYLYAIYEIHYYLLWLVLRDLATTLF